MGNEFAIWEITQKFNKFDKDTLKEIGEVVIENATDTIEDELVGAEDLDERTSAIKDGYEHIKYGELLADGKLVEAEQVMRDMDTCVREDLFDSLEGLLVKYGEDEK